MLINLCNLHLPSSLSHIAYPKCLARPFAQLTAAGWILAIYFYSQLLSELLQELVAVRGISFTAIALYCASLRALGLSFPDKQPLGQAKAAASGWEGSWKPPMPHLGAKGRLIMGRNKPTQTPRAQKSAVTAATKQKCGLAPHPSADADVPGTDGEATDQAAAPLALRLAAPKQESRHCHRCRRPGTQPCHQQSLGQDPRLCALLLQQPGRPQRGPGATEGLSELGNGDTLIIHGLKAHSRHWKMNYVSFISKKQSQSPFVIKFAVRETLLYLITSDISWLLVLETIKV